MPAGLDAVIERAVAKDPGRRYPTAGALIEAAREREGATPAATRVLSDTPGPADRGDRAAAPTAGRALRRGARRRRAGAGDLGPRRPRRAGRRGRVAPARRRRRLRLRRRSRSATAPLRVADRRALGLGDQRPRRHPDADRLGDRPVVGEPLRLGRGISGVAVGASSVWVASPRTGEVLRIDGDAGTDRGPDRRSAAAPARIVFGGDRVWVADEGGAGVTAINARGGRVFKRGIAPHAAPLRLAVGAGGVWVSSAATGSVRRIDLGTAVAGAAGRGRPRALGDHRRRRRRLGRQQPLRQRHPGRPRRPGRCSASRSRSAAGPGGIDAGTSVVWVANAADDTVSRIDIESGETVGDPIAGRPPPGRGRGCRRSGLGSRQRRRRGHPDRAVSRNQ